MLIDSITKKPIVLPRIHGNRKLRNPITGQRTMTRAQCRCRDKESAERLIKAFSDPKNAWML